METYKTRVQTALEVINGESTTTSIYDTIIDFCKKNNFVKANYAIQNLINKLSFKEELKEEHAKLLSLYIFCQEQARNKKFEVVIAIITELRNLSVPIKILTN